MSYADKWTDAELVKLENKIAKVYADAQKDLDAQAKAYFKQFEKRDEEMLKKVESGAVTEDYYKQWRLAQMGRGKRLDKMASDMAERATQANEVAVAYVNDATPGIYSLNRNHEAYVIEGLGNEMVGADFSLFNEQAVRRLIVEEPELMPYYPESKAVNRGIDLAYGKQQIQKNVTSGILQGKSVYKIADDLQRDITNMNRASAIRTARTAVTSAQNGGRQATMDAAKKMGIKLRKQWIATKDARTRDVHGKADRQIVDTDKPFDVGGEKLMFPGDSTSASGWNIYNCRCGMRTVEKEGIEAEPRQVRVRNPITGKNEVVSEMTYQEWYEARAKENPGEFDIARKKIYNESADKKQYKKFKAEFGENALSSFVDFQTLKYSKEWSSYKKYTRSIRSGELTPLANFRLYQKTSREIDKQLVGITTSNGITIKGKSDHFVARTIGSVEQRRNGVTITQIKSALTDPKAEVGAVRKSKNGNRSQKFRFDGVEVTVNPDTGNLIQTNPKT